MTDKKEENKVLDMLLNIIIVVGILYLVFAFTYDSYNVDSSMQNIDHNVTIANSNYPNNMTYSPNNITYSQIEPITDKPTFNKSTKPINISMATEEDKKLVSIMLQSYNEIDGDLQFSAKAAKDKSYKNLENAGILLKEDSKKYSTIVNNLTISPSFKVLFDEYKLSLENFYQVGKYLEKGSRNPISDNFRYAREYVKEAFDRRDNTYYLIGNDTRNNMTDNKIIRNQSKR